MEVGCGSMVEPKQDTSDITAVSQVPGQENGTQLNSTNSITGNQSFACFYYYIHPHNTSPCFFLGLTGIKFGDVALEFCICCQLPHLINHQISKL